MCGKPSAAGLPSCKIGAVHKPGKAYAPLPKPLSMKDNSMSDANSILVRFCPKCQCETERNSHKQCKPCVMARSAAWRIANPDKKKLYQDEYNKNYSSSDKYQPNKEQMAARRRKYKAENPEKVKLAEQKWRNNNIELARDRIRECSHSRRLADGKLSYGIKKSLFVLQRGKCACCGLPLGKEYHLDHIMPLALGGSNTDENIQLLRKRCNLQKNKKHPVDFMQSRGFLL